MYDIFQSSNVLWVSIEHNWQVLVNRQHLLQGRLCEEFFDATTVKQVAECPVRVVRMHERVAQPCFLLRIQLFPAQISETKKSWLRFVRKGVSS